MTSFVNLLVGANVNGLGSGGGGGGVFTRKPLTKYTFTFFRSILINNARNTNPINLTNKNKIN